MTKSKRSQTRPKKSLKQRVWMLEQKVGDHDQKLTHIIERLPKNGKPCKTFAQSKLSDFAD